jgi:hypothetical protein
LFIPKCSRFKDTPYKKVRANLEDVKLAWNVEGTNRDEMKKVEKE